MVKIEQVPLAMVWTEEVRWLEQIRVKAQPQQLVAQIKIVVYKLITSLVKMGLLEKKLRTYLELGWSIP